MLPWPGIQSARSRSRLPLDKIHAVILTKSKRLYCYAFAMIRLAKIQFLGPAAVLLTVGSAEIAAFALSRMPTSATLWYVNLKIFQVFQTSAFTLQPPLDFPCSQFLLIALPLFAMATYGLLTKRSFPLALASHLSFIYVGFLFYCQASSQMHPLTASIATYVATNSTIMYLPLFLAGASLISFAVSQYQYLLKLFFRNPNSVLYSENP